MERQLDGRETGRREREEGESAPHMSGGLTLTRLWSCWAECCTETLWLRGSEANCDSPVDGGRMGGCLGGGETESCRKTSGEQRIKEGKDKQANKWDGLCL